MSRSVLTYGALALLACLSLFGCARPNEAAPSAARPERIVSLAPSVTEMVYAVGAGDRVVGVDRFSDYPPDARKKPRIGDMNVNYERVVALKPDLVIGVEDLQAASLARLRDLGLNVLALDTTSYDKVIAAIEQVAAVVGEPAHGKTVTDLLRAERDSVRDGLEGLPTRSALIVIETEPNIIVAGRQTFLDELLTLAGAANVAPVTGFGPLSREGLARLHPDLVLTFGPEEAEALKRRLARLPGAPPPVVVLPPDVLTRPGPRIGDGLQRLAFEVRLAGREKVAP